MIKEPPTDIKKEAKPPQNFEQIHRHPNGVRVICRIKPLGQLQDGIDMTIDKINCQISIVQPRQQKIRTFAFNSVFTDQTQGQFVPDVCKRVLHEALVNKKGYLIFSYGVTNSGKTHTILGTQTQPGILPYLVRKLSQHDQVYLSAIQLYNDQFFSLTNKQKLLPKQICGFLDFEHYKISQQITSQNVQKKFKQYLLNRTQTQTKFNNKSSRSHAIFRIRTGKIVIGVVDLAGSERSNKDIASLDQTSNINKSLLCLGRCIKALKENPQTQQQIPYRQSKLTKVLIQYFASRVQVLMIANISQSQSCFHQNMKVLDYANLAKDIHHCNSQYSFNKSEYKHPPQPAASKLDIFETLYKSAIKSIHAHKTLKTSQSKVRDKFQTHHSKKYNTNQQFAKTLKAQQLQMHIEKFDSCHQTFQYFFQYINQKQLQQDHRRIQSLKSLNYQSPLYQQQLIACNTLPKQLKQMGVGRSQKSTQLMKQQIRDRMREQLRALLNEQRLTLMHHKQTQISPHHQYQLIKQELQTPQKQQSHDDNFIVKASNQILSSVKTILSKNVQSMKNIIPKLIKNKQKYEKFTICNYGSLFESLFIVEPPPADCKRSQQFSFYGDFIPNVKHSNHLIDNQTQTDSFQQEQLAHEQTNVEDNQNSVCNEIASKQTQVTARNSQVSIFTSVQQSKVTNQICENDEEQTSCEKQKCHKKSKATKNQKRKVTKSKPKANEKSKRVAQTRKIAVQFCLNQSRTPLKKRLRNHTTH